MQWFLHDVQVDAMDANLQQKLQVQSISISTIVTEWPEEGYLDS